MLLQRVSSSSLGGAARGAYSRVQLRCLTQAEKMSVTYPPPPPKEYLADGVTPKKYPLHQPIHNHGLNWEMWMYQPAGMFHTIYKGEYGNQRSWFKAYMKTLPFWVGFPLLFAALWSTAYVLLNFRYIGVKPKRYTPEWINAAKERERAENTNPVSRYMDRRRRERGPHFVLGNVLPYHQYYIWMRDSHDYEAAEAMVARRAKEESDE